jgi:hypothetical protein
LKNIVENSAGRTLKSDFNHSSLPAVVSFLIILIATTANVLAGPQIYYRDYKGMGCPEFNQHETVHLPHPYACNKYLTCLSKSVMEQTCPGNLHWNIEMNMCDYPDNAKCVDIESDNTVYYNRVSRRSRIQ